MARARGLRPRPGPSLGPRGRVPAPTRAESREVALYAVGAPRVRGASEVRTCVRRAPHSIWRIRSVASGDVQDAVPAFFYPDDNRVPLNVSIRRLLHAPSRSFLHSSGAVTG